MITARGVCHDFRKGGGCEMKLDRWFIVLVTVLFGIMILDMAVTLYGLSFGYSEGNPLIRFLFHAIGVKLTVTISAIIATVVSFGLIYIREKELSENKIRFYYTMIAILICYRALAVGAWFGLIVSQLNGRVPF